MAFVSKNLLDPWILEDRLLASLPLKHCASINDFEIQKFGIQKNSLSC